jgi:NAD+ synthase
MPADIQQFKARILLTPDQVQAEHDRILAFLRAVLGSESALCAVSGGLDSDVTTRLVVEAVGPEQVKLLIVQQDDFDPHFVRNAHGLADDLGIELLSIDLRGMPNNFIGALGQADPAMNFRLDGVLDVGRAKCSLRTAIFSTYQDRGYRVIGNSNKTEWLTGFFLPFGDGLAHVQPIFHLYKSQVAQLARLLGTAPAVIDQPGSSGFWIGADDLLDLSFWLYANGPIRQERSYSDQELDQIYHIREQLDREILDAAIDALLHDEEVAQIASTAGLSEETIVRLQALLKAASWKHVPMFQRVQTS